MTIEAQAADHSFPSAAEVKGRYGYARQFIADNGVSIKHFRHTVHLPEGRLVDQFGGLTAAFRKQGNFVQVATAVCSDDDNYNSKLGTALATERLANNQAILVPLLGATAHATVDDMFRHMFEDFTSIDGFEGFPQSGDTHPLDTLLRAFEHADTQPSMDDAGWGLFGDDPEAASGPVDDVWVEHAKQLVAALLSKLGGPPPEVLDSLKYLLEDAEDYEVAAVLEGTPAEHLAGSSNLLASVRQTAVTLLTCDQAGMPRIKVVFRIRPSESGQADGSSESTAGSLDSLGQGLADFLAKARGGIPDAVGELGDRLGLKKAFDAIPAQDLLAALRKTPHAAAAAAFLQNLQKPSRGGSGEIRG